MVRGGRPLGRFGHSVLDALIVLLLPLCAHALRLAGAPRVWAWRFAGLIALAVTFTRTPLGLVRVVPWVWHGRAELAGLAVQVLLLGTHSFRSHPRGRAFFAAFAAVNLLVWRLTDWEATDGRRRA